MKGKGVSKENAEKAQLKAKAREPGKTSLLFCLQSFYPQYPSFLSFILLSNLIYCPDSLFPILTSSLHFYYLSLISPLMSLFPLFYPPYFTYIIFCSRCKSKEGRGCCCIIRRIRERGEQSRARQATSGLCRYILLS